MKRVLKIMKLLLYLKKLKIFVWIKRDGCNKGRKGITILNEGCIPIPDWVKD